MPKSPRIDVKLAGITYFDRLRQGNYHILQKQAFERDYNEAPQVEDEKIILENQQTNVAHLFYINKCQSIGIFKLNKILREDNKLIVSQITDIYKSAYMAIVMQAEDKNAGFIDWNLKLSKYLVKYNPDQSFMLEQDFFKMIKYGEIDALLQIRKAQNIQKFDENSDFIIPPLKEDVFNKIQLLKSPH